MYCKATFTVLAPSTYGGALTFFKLTIDAVEYTGSTTSFYDIPALKTFLNSLNIGAWSVIPDGSDGLIIKLLNFTDEKTIVLTGKDFLNAEVDFSPTYEDCSDSINGDSCNDDCFENFIGLKEVCEPTTKNCVWLNDAGVNSKTLEDLLTKDYADISAFYKAKVKFAIRQISESIYSHFENKFKATSIIEDSRIGFIAQNKQLITSPTGKAGIVNNFKNCSDYIKFYGSKLSLFTDYTGTVIVEVWDVYQNKLIEAGLDEAGRGCYAGPVFAAAVILPKDFFHPLLNDSKLLNEKQRDLKQDPVRRNIFPAQT